MALVAVQAQCSRTPQLCVTNTDVEVCQCTDVRSDTGLEALPVNFSIHATALSSLQHVALPLVTTTARLKHVNVHVGCKHSSALAVNTHVARAKASQLDWAQAVPT
jgi:hypothetical protein